MSKAIQKTVLITGATGLVGGGLVRHFSRRGYRVVITARDKTQLVTLAGAENAHYFAADLANSESLTELAAHLERAERSPDILINNAADVMSKPLLETSLGEIEHSIRVNVTGALQLARIIAPAMIAKGGGTIVNISSLAGYKPNPQQTVYSVSKAAVNAISDALRAELGVRGVQVVNVALMGVGEGPGRIGLEVVARRIEDAIVHRERDVFFYARTKWLMRLYAAFPSLARLK